MSRMRLLGMLVAYRTMSHLEIIEFDKIGEGRIKKVHTSILLSLNKDECNIATTKVQLTSKGTHQLIDFAISRNIKFVDVYDFYVMCSCDTCTEFMEKQRILASLM